MKHIFASLLLVMITGCAHHEVRRYPASSSPPVAGQSRWGGPNPAWDKSLEKYRYETEVQPILGTHQGLTERNEWCTLELISKVYTQESRDLFNELEIRYSSQEYSYHHKLAEFGRGIWSIGPWNDPEMPADGTFYLYFSGDQFHPWGAGAKLILNKEGRPLYVVYYDDPVFGKLRREFCKF